MNYWLLKSEPDTFSYDDLENAPEDSTIWDGVRNYQARNILRDGIKTGDLAFFYHSSCKTPGIAGICRVTETGIPDPTALDPTSDYFDPKSSVESPRWITIKVQAESALKRYIPLSEMRNCEALQSMVLLKSGRLSVQPVTDDEWNFILTLASTPQPE